MANLTLEELAANIAGRLSDEAKDALLFAEPNKVLTHEHWTQKGVPVFVLSELASHNLIWLFSDSNPVTPLGMAARANLSTQRGGVE